MQNKFIKFKIQNGEPIYCYINPIFITSVEQLGVQDKCAVNTMDGKTFYAKETVDEVMKKIKEANEFKITLDK
jgi:uncharacterized protein YlzI (FlbEa/FlbD family)